MNLYILYIMGIPMYACAFYERELFEEAASDAACVIAKHAHEVLRLLNPSLESDIYIYIMETRLLCRGKDCRYVVSLHFVGLQTLRCHEVAVLLVLLIVISDDLINYCGEGGDVLGSEV